MNKQFNNSQIIRRLSLMEESLTITNMAFPLTVVCALRLSVTPSQEAVQAALNHLQHVHPLLQASIQKRGKRFWFVKDEPNPIPLRREPRTGEDYWCRITKQELNHHFDHRVGPLIQVSFIVSPVQSGNSELILALHHAITDGTSLLSMARQFLSLIGEYSSGKDIPSEFQIFPLFPGMDQIFPSAYKFPRMVFRLISFMMSQFQDEFRLNKDLKKNPAIIPASSENDILMLSFSEEETQALIRWSRNRIISLNSIITGTMLMALYHHKYPGQNRILHVIQFANLRPYLRPPVNDHADGCYVSLMRFPIPISPDSQIQEIAEYLDKQLKNASDKGGKFFFALLSKMATIRAMKLKNSRMGEVAFSFSGVIPVKENSAEMMLHDMHGFISSDRLATTLSGFGKIIFGRLSIDLNYLTEETSREIALKISEDIKTHLLRLITDL